MSRLRTVAAACFRDLDEMRFADCSRLSPVWVLGLDRYGYPMLRREKAAKKMGDGR